MVEYVLLDGNLIPFDEARVPILDRGLLYGEGVFDTMRVYDGRAFRLAEHLHRLVAGAETLGLRCPVGPSELSAYVANLLRANQLRDAYLRITLTRGDGGFGMEAQPDITPRLFIVARPLPPTPDAIYTHGVSAIVSSIRRNETSPLSRIKSLNYLDNLLARAEARRSNADEAILLNTRGGVTEAASSNIFLVLREGMDNSPTLVTPDLASGVLPGITRAVVLQLAEQIDIASTERPVSSAELDSASETFLTNSMREIVPLVRVGDRVVGKGSPGDVTRQIAAAYRELVEEDSSVFPWAP